MLRGLFIGALFFTVTPVLISIQWLLGKLGLPGWGFISCNYYRVLARLLRLRVRVVGAPLRGRPVLFVSNHVSWLDIIAIGSIQPVAFVAKSEVRKWPLVGITATMQRTVFVERAKRHQTADAVTQMVERLKGGTPVVLFAEGTSSDGNRVLPFRSALLGAVEMAARHGGVPGLAIQPMAICYTASQGIPLGRQHRPLAAWYGDLDFMPHIRALIGRTALDAVVSFGAAVPAEAGLTRKAMTQALEQETRRLMAETLRGKPLAPAPATTA
ncbi:MAG TPA: lysophospholipid acyltransferase family protein [Pseudolabrys sp.]|nr:lysophospholipid acyltransferase family protein [Pseudolabrys sp.]